MIERIICYFAVLTFWMLLLGALVWTFNDAMRKDKAQLCMTDATAYDGCS